MSASNCVDRRASIDIKKLLCIIEDVILPKTEKGVEDGNKVFGAAIINRLDLSPIVSGTNNETKSPLLHGEINVIQKWSEIPTQSRTHINETVFLSTHEPCCMCISAIVWAGFKTVFYLFPYETTRDQGIPHDLEIMKELWGVERYIPENKFCSTHSIMDIVDSIPDTNRKSDLYNQFQRIESVYNRLSSHYHSIKPKSDESGIVFD